MFKFPYAHTHTLHSPIAVSSYAYCGVLLSAVIVCRRDIHTMLLIFFFTQDRLLAK